MTSLRTALHEAGHALVAIAVGLPLKHITIVPMADAAGEAVLDLPDPPSSPGVALQRVPDELRVRLKIIDLMWGLGGELAEEIGFGAVTCNCDGDRVEATDSFDDVWEVTGVEPAAWRPALRDVTRDFLRANEAQLWVLATTLLQERTVSGSRAKELVGDLVAPNVEGVYRGIRWWAAKRARQAGGAKPAGWRGLGAGGDVVLDPSLIVMAHEDLGRWGLFEHEGD